MTQHTKRKTARNPKRVKRTLPLLTAASQQQIWLALQEMAQRGELASGQPGHEAINKELDRLGFPPLKPPTISKALDGLEFHGYIRRPFEITEARI